MPAVGPTEIVVIVVVLAVLGLLVAAAVGVAVLVARRGGRRPAGGQTLEARLRELDDLRARGLLSAQEHAAARERALGL